MVDLPPSESDDMANHAINIMEFFDNCPLGVCLIGQKPGRFIWLNKPGHVFVSKKFRVAESKILQISRMWDSKEPLSRRVALCLTSGHPRLKNSFFAGLAYLERRLEKIVKKQQNTSGISSVAERLPSKQEANS